MKQTFFDSIISRRKDAKNKANNRPVKLKRYCYHIQPKDRELAIKNRYYTYLGASGDICMNTVDTPDFVESLGFTNLVVREF